MTIQPATSNNSIGGARVAAIDGLRGLLAVVVLAWHACGVPLHPFFLMMSAIAAVGVFFVLSGYALTRGWDGRFGIFLLRRFTRLWPVYALCLGAGYLIAGVHPVWSEFFWYPYIGPDAKPSIDPPMWSLFFEIRMMPFMPLFVWAGSGALGRAALFMAALLIASMFDSHFFVGFLFVVGATLARFRLPSPFLEAALPQWLGKVSYSLYLSHWLVLDLATRTFGPWAAIPAVPLAFAIAWLVWWGVERPSIAASRRIGNAAARLRQPGMTPPLGARIAVTAE
jgi:peptidoglycan/LPS O-acetylase OafA/YrhL